MSQTPGLSAHTPHAALPQGHVPPPQPEPIDAESKANRTPGNNVAPVVMPPASSITTTSSSSISTALFPPSSFQSPPHFEHLRIEGKRLAQTTKRVPSRPINLPRPDASASVSRRVSLSPAIALMPMQEPEAGAASRPPIGANLAGETPTRVSRLLSRALNEQTAARLTGGFANSQRFAPRTVETQTGDGLTRSPLPLTLSTQPGLEEETPSPLRQPTASPTTQTVPPHHIVELRPQPPAHPLPAQPGEGNWLAGEEMMRVPGVADLVQMCRQDADISVAQGLQAQGYLDRLYEIYKAHTPATILAHDPMRTAMTLSLLVDLDVSPQQFRQALAHGAVRDFFAQGAVSEGGYLGSWGAATAIVIRLLDDGSSEFGRALYPALMAGIGLCMVLRLQRKGDLFPSWSVPRVFDLKGKPVVPASTTAGFAKSCLAYWGFSIPLLLVALDTHVASTSTDKAALSLKKAWRRLNWNMLSSGFVAVTRYFMFERERVYLNARPVYPGESPNFQKWVMKGALEELTSGPRWHDSALMKTAVIAPLRYGVSGAEGLARWFGLDCIPDHLESKQVVANRAHIGRQEDYEATMTDHGLDVLSGFVLSATALFVNGLALWISHQSPRKAREWDVAHSILILQMSWGVAVALRDLMSKWNESVTQDTKAVIQRRRLRLATQAGLGRPDASLVAPRVQAARARHAQANAQAIRNPDPAATD